MTLTPRLAAVASFVPPCGLLADIGTDHAYIPIYLAQKGVIKHGVASDVAAGPAKIAENNVRQHRLEHSIDVVVCNGLEGIDSADVIVIAGMGGKLMCDIIEEGIEVARRASLLVLQPMTAVEDVRRFLHEKRFAICDEAIAKEGNKLYNIMTAADGPMEVGDDIYYYIGEKLIQNRDKHLGEYILKKVNSLSVAIDVMAGGNAANGKAEEFIKLRERLSEVYNDCYGS